MGDVRPDQRHQGVADQDDLRRRGGQGEHRLPVHRRGRDLVAGRRPADRLHRAQGRVRRRRQAAVHRDERHRRTVRRRPRRPVAPRRGDRRLDADQPRAVVELGQLLRLQRPDDRPPGPGHDHGRHADLLVPGHPGVPLHRPRRDVVAHLGLERLPRPHPALRPRHLRCAVAHVRQAVRAAGAEPEARLDDRVVRDRPVRLRVASCTARAPRSTAARTSPPGTPAARSPSA